MFSMMIAALVLANEAPQDIEVSDTFTEAEHAFEVQKELLSSKAISTLLSAGSVPNYCEVYYQLDLGTGQQYCTHVICRPRTGDWTFHDCEDFGLPTGPGLG